MKNKQAMTLDRVLSRFGLASRTGTRECIRAGRVKVNGRVTRDPEVRVHPAADRFHLDGIRLQRARRIYLLFYKPKGSLQQLEMGVRMLDLQAEMPRTGGNQEIVRRHGPPLAAAGVGQPACGFPNLVRDGQFGDALFVNPEQGPVGFAADPGPEFEPDYGTPGGFASAEKPLHARAHRGIPAPADLVNPA